MSKPLCALISLCVCSAAVAATGTPPITLIVQGPSKQGAVARKTGDMLLIHQLAAAKKIGPLDVAISDAQIRYDFPKLVAAAVKCQRNAVSAKFVHWEQNAAYCAQFARVAAIGMGDAHRYLEEADYEQRVVMPAFVKHYHVAVRFGNGLDNVDLSKLATSTPALQVNWRRAQSTLPVAPTVDTGSSGRPLEVSIRIDGVATDAMLRIASGLRAPVTVVAPVGDLASVYKQYRLHPLIDPIEHISAHGDVLPGKRAGSTGALALAPMVQVGPLVLRNLGVEIIGNDNVPSGVYLGTSLLARFGGVAIGRKDIVLSKQPLAGCGASVPMVFASDWLEHGSLMFPAQLNGHKVMTEWAPDVAGWLTVDGTTFASATGTPANSFVPEGHVKRSPVTVTVAGRVLRPSSISTPPTWHAPYQMQIGAGVLQHHDAYLSFDGKQPTIAFCNVSARNQQSPPSAP